MRVVLYPHTKFSRLVSYEPVLKVFYSQADACFIPGLRRNLRPVCGGSNINKKGKARFFHDIILTKSIRYTSNLHLIKTSYL